MSQHRFTTSAGDFTGTGDGAVVRVRGVRYARADRFRPPVRLGADDAAVQDPRPAVACPQPPDPAVSKLGDPYAGVVFDEDCHRLAITVPAGTAPGDRLPVLVWIHGGAYVAGGGDLPVYDPALLVAEHRVVVVNVTYRLGLLGHLAAVDGHRRANLSLLDQVAALEWVRENVAAFGGDPDLVTVFGESAGADAIVHLLACDAARGLFRRAVVQSAPLGLRRRRERLRAAMDAAVGHVPADAPLADVFAAQRAAEAAAARFGTRGAMPFGTEYGHAPLPPEDQVEDRWRAAARHVDVLVGATTQETTFFTDGVPLLGRPVVGPALRRGAVAATTRALFTRPAQRLAALLRTAGGTVHEYRVPWRPRGSALGATHTVELPLLFEHPTAWRDAAVLGDATAEEVHAAGLLVREAWARFARTGDPGPTRDPAVLRLR
nr:carboxylesterase family protein [Kineococcus siccus]